MQNIYVFNEVDKLAYEYVTDQCYGKKVLLSVSVEFDKTMAAGLAQAKDDDSFDMDEVFDESESGQAKQ